MSPTPNDRDDNFVNTIRYLALLRYPLGLGLLALLAPFWAARSGMFRSLFDVTSLDLFFITALGVTLGWTILVTLQLTYRLAPERFSVRRAQVAGPVAVLIGAVARVRFVLFPALATPFVGICFSRSASPVWENALAAVAGISLAWLVIGFAAVLCPREATAF